MILRYYKQKGIRQLYDLEKEPIDRYIENRVIKTQKRILNKQQEQQKRRYS